jgi:hypothetical protein
MPASGLYSQYIQCPADTSANRPSPSNGMMRYNTTLNGLEIYSGSAWIQFGGIIARYWRYVEGSAVVAHHPRVSRIIFLDENYSGTNIVVYTGDNCSDQGAYQIGTVSYDFGASTPKRIVRAQIYSSYPGGERVSNYTVQYSSDNTNWTTAFSGTMANSNYPAGGGVGCGVYTGTGYLA